MPLKVLTWTPSRYAKWKECPAKVRYEDLMKLCPVCFKGKISGGFNGEPVQCDSCDKPQPDRAPMARGDMLDTAITAFVSKTEEGPKYVKEYSPQEHLAEATRHPFVEKLAEKLRKTKGVVTQDQIVLDSNWTRVSKFTKNAWARLKMDVLVVAAKAQVIDWKSGNIDKSKGVIRERAEYHDSMRAYQVATLAVYPQVKEVSAKMVFLDAPPKLADPTKSLPVLKRADFDAAKADWERKIDPMMNDTVFAPKPGMQCKWCPFSKDKGGPCIFEGNSRG